MSAPLSNEDVALRADLAAALAHRGCCGTEHDPANGKLHGYCVVCGVPWPCDTAKYFLREAPTTLENRDDGRLTGRLTKRAVIEAYCRLSSEVAEALHWQHAADCFCANPDGPRLVDTYRYEACVLEFVRDAVREKIERNKTALEQTP